MINGGFLRVLAVDDEPPALDELAYLLRADPRVATVNTASDVADAFRVLRDNDVDAVFLDIRMPGLDGLDVARVLARFRAPPKVVFVTAYDEHAVEAFDLRAVDYLLKPVRAERLAEAVRRVREALGGTEQQPPSDPADDETIAVELGGVTRFVQRSDVRYAEAHGDYARLHTADGSHLLRVPLTVLEEDWAVAGFVRIHRSHLVALHHIDEMRVDSGRWTVRLGEDVLQVSRRHTRELRDMLVRRARPAAP
jgi:DNA-binding LytR/AlgR family response regulator